MPDYDSVVGGAEAPVSSHVAESIIDSEVGPALAYHLARNPEVLTRLNSMSAMQSARELGRIEASIVSAPTQTAATVAKTTTAPRPAGTSTSQGRTTVPDPKDMSMDEYRKHRAAQGARWAR